MELHGVTGAPYKHPEVRKRMPDPFTRPSIAVGGGAKQIKRSWQDVSVTALQPGDTVAGFGSVDHTVEFTNVEQVWEAGGWEQGGEDILVDRQVWTVRVFNVMGEHTDYPGEQRVYAFAEPGRRAGR